jgi:hypothetical protein
MYSRPNYSVRFLSRLVSQIEPTPRLAILYMHRGFFAKAMEENSDDPLASKYSPSVLAVYNTSCTFIGVSESFHAIYPALVDRMWFLYGHVFS